jgi:DNA (cytosine-5)-methyltransferase 1
MRHGSLFSGIGGFDLAAEWMGWENVFHCEWNEFGQKILHHYWPNAIQYNDITQTDFTIHRGCIDILTGGFPCQPYSTAGKRKGKEDERHLWPQMCRAIREIQPRWVVGENVLGLVNWSGGLVFHEVQADLEAAGYEVWPYVLPAVSVGAPHRRDRIWFVAFNTKSKRNTEVGRICERQNNESIGICSKITPHPNGNGFNQRNGNDEEQPGERGVNAQRDVEQGNEYGDAADTDEQRLERTAADRNMGRQQRPLQRGIESTRNWKNFPTQSPICGGDDGIPTKLDGITFSKWRNESIKGYGNAIVPQVVYQIFKAIEEYERSTNPARHHPEAHR